MPVYRSSKELEDLGKQLIADHRATLKILKVIYVFRDEASLSNEKLVAGRCIRTDERHWALFKHDFIIEVAKDVWDEATGEFRTALMDHELGHVGIRFDEKGSPLMDEKTGRLKTYVRMHDVEEFEDVLERYGAYHKDLRSFLRKFEKQLIDAKSKKPKQAAPAEEVAPAA